MSAIAFGLLILASGWVLYRTWHLTRFRALKEAGHPQYFAAVIAAAYLLVIALSTRLIVLELNGTAYVRFEAAVVASLPLNLAKDDDAKSVRKLAAITLWCVLLLYPLVFLLNAPPVHSAGLRRALIKRAGSYNRLDAITEHVLGRGLSLAVTLNSGKVYIGTPVYSSSLDEERQWIALFPLISGARDEQGRLQITTKYSPVYANILAGLEDVAVKNILSDFQIVIPMSQVASLQAFDIEIYNKFRDAASGEMGQNTISESSSIQNHAIGTTGEVGDGWGEHPLPIEDITESESFAVYMYYAFVAVLTLTIVLVPYTHPVALIFGGLVSWMFSCAACRTEETSY